MATEAGVKTVVLSHLVPGSNRNSTAEYPDSSYIEGVGKRSGSGHRRDVT